MRFSLWRLNLKVLLFLIHLLLNGTKCQIEIYRIFWIFCHFGSIESLIFESNGTNPKSVSLYLYFDHYPKVNWNYCKYFVKVFRMWTALMDKGLCFILLNSCKLLVLANSILEDQWRFMGLDVNFLWSWDSKKLPVIQIWNKIFKKQNFQFWVSLCLGAAKIGTFGWIW